MTRLSQHPPSRNNGVNESSSNAPPTPPFFFALRTQTVLSLQTFYFNLLLQFTAQTHTVSISLQSPAGTVSPDEGMTATTSYRQQRRRKSMDRPTIYEWLFCIIGMGSIIGVAFFPNFKPLWPFKVAACFLFRKILVIRVIAIAATAAHVGEAIYAWRLATRVDPANASGWFWQTLALGYRNVYICDAAKDSKEDS
ncbi:hypothetical protein AKJ16_DCAP14533 [Drosera capensis]